MERSGKSTVVSEVQDSKHLDPAMEKSGKSTVVSEVQDSKQ
jgi:hypothetical protein